jgi:hypothetical protein
MNAESYLNMILLNKCKNLTSKERAFLRIQLLQKDITLLNIFE